MIAIIQARLCSSRLPGKALFTFFGLTMIERACSIASEIKGVDRIVLATGNRIENQIFKQYTKPMGVEFFSGSENNVLQRFCDVIANYDGTYLLRMTADNYLIQPDVIEATLAKATDDDADYAFVSPLSHFGGEIIRCESLRECLAGHHSVEAEEHVSWDIRNSSNYKISSLPDNCLGIDHTRKISLDTINDLIFMKEVEFQHPELKNLRCVEMLRTLPSGS